MDSPMVAGGDGRVARSGPSTSPTPQSANLADILERVLDKGIVIAGDIRVNLLDIELLTVKIRLLVASVDKAAEIGIDWWKDDPSLSSGARGGDDRELEDENSRLRQRIEELESSGELESGERQGTHRD